MGGAVVFLFLSLLAICQAAVHVAAPAPVRCGQMPVNISNCLEAPHIVTEEVSTECAWKLPQCEKIKCLFAKSGWMNGDAIHKPNLTAFFGQFGKDNPQWQRAVDAVKTACLQAELPPQGVHLNCPAYDAMHCIYTAFLRNADPSLWSTSKACEYTRQFAASCPVCPSGCFDTQIPAGACNACHGYPKSLVTAHLQQKTVFKASVATGGINY